MIFIIHRSGQPYTGATGRRTYFSKKNAEIARTMIMAALHRNEGTPAHELIQQFTVETYTPTDQEENNHVK